MKLNEAINKAVKMGKDSHGFRPRSWQGSGVYFTAVDDNVVEKVLVGMGGHRHRHGPRAYRTYKSFFAHHANECDTAPETIWHKDGKAAVLAALNSMGIPGREEVQGCSPDGDKWVADVIFSVFDRTIVIELQRSYQHLRDFKRRQERYIASGVECYWLVRKKTFMTLGKATSRLLLKREFGNVYPPGGIGTGMLPELPVAMLDTEAEQLVQFGMFKTAPVKVWLAGILDGAYQYRGGTWNLG